METQVLLHEPGLPRVQRRIDPGFHFAGQAGRITSRSTSPKASVSKFLRSLAGDLTLSEAELRTWSRSSRGRLPEKLNDSTKAISDRWAGRYAFANVNAAPELDKEKHQVAFTIFVDPGRRVYVRRNITGNVKTADEVIRREMRQMEGGWYDAGKVALSKQRVDKLGIFQEVTVETPCRGGDRRPARRQS